MTESSDSVRSPELAEHARQLEARLQELARSLLEAESASLPPDFRDRAAARTSLIHLREALVAARRALERLDAATGVTGQAPQVFREDRVERARSARRASRPSSGSGEQMLPPGLSRFVRDRLRSPGFEWRVENDVERGWTLHWKDWGEDGQLLGSGRIVEGPWVDRSD